MFGKLSPEEIHELREQQIRYQQQLKAEELHELREQQIRYQQQLKEKEKHVHIPYRPPRVTVRETYRPKGMIAAFIDQCKPVDCFPVSKKKGGK